MSRAIDLHALQEEAAGVMGFHVLQPEDVPEPVSHALRGDRDALQLAHALSDLLDRIAAVPGSKPMLCGCCPRPLPEIGFTGFSAIIATPERPDASRWSSELENLAA